ncbi:4'-phosphopantetheinyl transferase family protein [Streptomyces sp. NPDC008001]|uniref:4'-phosphopantetheinyl transferase family protein n=1 Tax=Streptomyces sp. NPDC008001 TaxID=3364804 RepID=UPI0036DFC0B2
MRVSGGPGIRPRVLGEDPLPGAWTPGGPHVWLMRLDGLWPDGFAHGGPRPGSPLAGPLRDHARILDAGERERAAAFVRDQHRERYIASHVGLRLLLGAYLGTDPAAVVLVREPCPGCGGPHGRPAAAGAPLHFNLSHAGDVALFAFADTPVGADVEQVQPAEVVDEVARVLHRTETAELAALPAAQRPDAFARCWTRKEAYLKGTGTGLSENPSVTYVGTGPEPASPAGWTLSDVPAVPGYAAAVAVANAPVPDRP